jgi:hypothetical protein
MVRVSGYRCRGAGFDSRPYQFFWEVGGLEWNGVHSASWGQLRSYLNKNVAAPVCKIEINGRGNSLGWPHNTLYLHYFADNRRSLGRYSSFADCGHRVSFMYVHENVWVYILVKRLMYAGLTVKGSHSIREQPVEIHYRKQVGLHWNLFL